MLANTCEHFVEVAALEHARVPDDDEAAARARQRHIEALLGAQESDRTLLVGADEAQHDVGVVNNTSHPNDAMLFVNWMLTKDGMQSSVDADATPGIRTDMDYSKLNPDDVPVAGTQYFDECNYTYVTGEKAQLNDQLKVLLPH